MINWSKPVVARDGRHVRIFCTDCPGTYPVIGLVDGEEEPKSWTLDGVFFIGSGDILSDNNILDVSEEGG